MGDFRSLSIGFMVRDVHAEHVYLNRLNLSELGVLEHLAVKKPHCNINLFQVWIETNRIIYPIQPSSKSFYFKNSSFFSPRLGSADEGMLKGFVRV